MTHAGYPNIMQFINYIVSFSELIKGLHKISTNPTFGDGLADAEIILKQLDF